LKIEYNISRLNYLLDLYKLTIEDLISIISDGLKNPIPKTEILSNEIKINYLKRIDKVFNRGLNYYIDPKQPEISKDASIFFRKDSFNSDLNIGSKKIINHFEDFKISLSAVSKLADIKLDRKIPIYDINDNAKYIANSLREQLYPAFNNNIKEFLKSLISKFAEWNILVFEFVETWNKKEKANIDGCFLNPNVIVLKRQQNSFRREIFTLIHELGHYLLNEEEIESVDYLYHAKMDWNIVEKWCNEFAYHFLVGEYGETISKLEEPDPSNDYHFDLIEKVSRKTHLSQIALYTQLLLKNKISRSNYKKIRNDFEERYILKRKEEKRLRELENEGRKNQGGSTPKPIKSPLLVSTIQTAFYEGIINEYEVCKKLNIKPDKLEKYIQ